MDNSMNRLTGPSITIDRSQETNNKLSNMSLTDAYNAQRTTTLQRAPMENASVDLSTSFETPKKTETSGFASSAMGDLELTKYLYESGLQNIFSDYQKNIQTLQQQEAQQLQQAYVAREMSKKYLGEYASNVGIGDVSGSLIDIYSQYASNISDIEQNFAALEMNLSREYTQERMATFENILRTQYALEVSELDAVANEASQFVFTEFDTDVQGGLAYLDSQRENMREQDYEAVKDAYYRSNVDSVIANLSSDTPYFGFADLESQTLKTQEQYIEEARQWLEPDDFRKVQEVIALKELVASNEGEIDFGEPNLSINARLYSTDPLVTEDSEVYTISNTNFAVASQPIVNDDVAFNSNITPDLLNQQFETQSGKSAAEAKQDDIVQYQGFYILKEGQWHRMVNIGLSNQTFDTLTANELKTWNVDSMRAPARGVEINFDYGNGGADAIIVNGQAFVEDLSVGEIKNEMENREIPMSNLVEYLNKTFGTGLTQEEESRGIKINSKEVQDYVPKGQIFQYEGKFYVYTEDGEKIRPMVLEVNEETE